MFLMNLINMNSIMLVYSKTPISMMMNLIFQMSICCMTMNYLLKFSWFSYLTFIIMVGGLMILFLFTCTSINNIKMKPNFNLMMLMIWIYINMLIMNPLQFMINLNKLNLSMYFLNLENYKMNLIKFFMKFSLIILFIMINLLLMTMIIVNKMNFKNNNPLRIKN
uniref:NADH dehydrogenase subunit 6 n=1 Tax=Neucentropus mandjuricus TaxID=1223783 RepID=UPI002114F1F4|nr:NADH dehydrogenase subunit 6 [Neucentropus mandjuricus]USL48459.1 NADH dehydrogenase subunit 6 [Neucentropus mandjuricus]